MKFSYSYLLLPWWELFSGTQQQKWSCFLIQPLEQEGGCHKCCISLCSKVFINHFYQKKASPGCLNILIYWSIYWVDRLRRTIRRKAKTGIFYQQIYRLCHYILHQVAHIDCSAPSGKQHESLIGVWGIVQGTILNVIFVTNDICRTSVFIPCIMIQLGQKKNLQIIHLHSSDIYHIYLVCMKRWGTKLFFSFNQV